MPASSTRPPGESSAGDLLCRQAEVGDATGGWRSLPRWASAIWDAGTRLATHSRSTPQVVAVSLPFRNWAAALFAGGFAIERIAAGSFESRFSEGDLVVTIRKRKGQQWAELALFHGYVSANQAVDSPGARLQRFRDELTGEDEGFVRAWARQHDVRRAGATFVFTEDAALDLAEELDEGCEDGDDDRLLQNADDGDDDLVDDLDDDDLDSDED